MKRKIDLVMITSSVTTVEIDFPIYRRENHYPPEGDFVTLTRINADLSELIIEYKNTSRTGKDVRYTIETKQGSQCVIKPDEHDFFLGEGIYECAPDTFAKELENAIAFLTSMKLV